MQLGAVGPQQDGQQSQLCHRLELVSHDQPTLDHINLNALSGYLHIIAWKDHPPNIQGVHTGRDTVKIAKIKS